MKFLADVVCNRLDPANILCTDIVFTLAGVDVKQLNEVRNGVMV